MEILENIPLAPLTTFGIGGNARYFVEVKNTKDLQAALDFAADKSLSYVILAGGSNVLISDNGYDGLVIHIKITKKLIYQNTRTLGAGCVLWDEIRNASNDGFGGWEKLSGVPGTIGGAVRGNAGAFGVEMKDVLTKVEVFNTKSGEIEHFSNEECHFEYRHSFFKDNPHLIILSATITLASVDATASLAISDETVNEREKRHLQNIPCAGSYFTNPVAPQWVVDEFESEKKVTSKNGRVPAGWLIEKVGLRGYRSGNAMSSEMHANYVINCGNATAADVRTVGETIKEKIRTEYMTHVFEEVSMVGF